MNRLRCYVSKTEPAFYALEPGLFFCPVAEATGQSSLVHFVCDFPKTTNEMSEDTIQPAEATGQSSLVHFVCDFPKTTNEMGEDTFSLSFPPAEGRTGNQTGCITGFPIKTFGNDTGSNVKKH